MKTKFRYCLLFSFAFFFCYSAYAQEDTITYEADSVADFEQETIDTFVAADRVLVLEDWKDLTADSAFHYRNEKEAEQKIKEPESIEENGILKFLGKIFGFFISKVGQIIFWSLVFLILVYVLYKIFSSDVSFIFGRKEKLKTDENKDELSAQDLTEDDWETKLNNAIAAQNKTLATRYAFVHVLQLLHQKQKINYRMDTTNFEYYRSIEDAALKASFRKLLLRYEYAWFGRFEVSEAEWNETMNMYNEIKSKI